MTKKIVLCCEKCQSRNYVIPINKQRLEERFTIKKYCNICNEHTVHKQSV